MSGIVNPHEQTDTKTPKKTLICLRVEGGEQVEISLSIRQRDNLLIH